MATKKKTLTATKRPTTPPIDGDNILFKRTAAKVPRSMLSAADLWLDLFITFMESIVQNDHDGVRTKNYPHLIAQEARALADEALDVYQTRWPNIEPGA